MNREILALSMHKHKTDSINETAKLAKNQQPTSLKYPSEK